MQAKMLGTGDEQTHNARTVPSFGDRGLLYAEFSLEPSLFFETQNINCETRTLFRV
jgi:hypothetical protein